jgi:hypothetical protein
MFERLWGKGEVVIFPLICSGSTVRFANLEEVWTLSMNFFHRSLEGFHKVKDSRNEAVVLLNIIRLHKIAAGAHINDLGVDRSEFGSQERHHFNEVKSLKG